MYQVPRAIYYGIIMRRIYHRTCTNDTGRDPYCSKTQGGAGRERGDTHRTRTGAEQHHTPAQTDRQTPTPARTAARTHPDGTRNKTVGTTRPRNNPGPQGPDKPPEEPQATRTFTWYGTGRALLVHYRYNYREIIRNDTRLWCAGGGARLLALSDGSHSYLHSR